jgi:type VI secretion system protein
MKLILTVVASQPGGAPPGTARAFERAEAVIGRGAGCDWILPDPANHLSKRHCVVGIAGGRATVTDTSTNGVFVNDAPQPLGNGATAALADGDRLTLGDYVLEARIAAVAESRRDVAIDETDPFGIAEFQVKPPPPPPPPPPLETPAPPEPSFPPFQMAPIAAGTGGPLIPEDFDILADEPAAAPAAPQRSEADWRAEAMPDNVAAERVAFVAPKVEGGGIPDDWLSEANASTPALAAVPERAMRLPAGDLFGAFLAGAGIDGDALATQDPAAVMRAAGRAYRAAVLGFAEILRARTMVKSEFRIEQTRIGAIGNNPLKFLGDPDEIVAAMLGEARPGFQEASAALGDGVRDLKAHQLAVLAAMQIALMKLIQQLDPAALKARLEGSSLLDAVLPGARKARYWEVFEASYKAIAGQLEEDFHGAFGKAFAEAYEDEMRKL